MDFMYTVSPDDVVIGAGAGDRHSVGKVFVDRENDERCSWTKLSNSFA